MVFGFRLLIILMLTISLTSSFRLPKLSLKVNVVRSSYRFLSSSAVETPEPSVMKVDPEKIRQELQSYHASFPAITSEQWILLERLCLNVSTWNEKINLISRKEIDQIVAKHLIPSLSISLLIPFQNQKRIIDIGTGGGFPGLPLAVLFPNASFTLLDSTAKKIKAVREVSKSLQLRNVKFVVSRAEDYHGAYDFILGRAVADLPTFLSFTAHLLKPGPMRNNTKKPNKTIDIKPSKKDAVVTTATEDRRMTATEEELNVEEGMFYIKGGEFRNELNQAKIKSFKRFKMNDLVPSLNNDKNILFIPGEEVRSFKPKK
jgi:16S rRNA (guanine(527)-N(7))-methyltransferase RsmG